ncbi:MAG: hypothetical protein AAB652_01795 [Patescibacteria group bacterium]
MKAFINKTHHFLTKNKVVVVLIIVLSVVGTAYTFLQKSSPSETYNVTSKNQEGGITAGKIVVEGATPRHLNTEHIAELNKYLPPSREMEIQIWYLMGNAEAQQYASEIKSYLESQGWKVDPFLGSFNLFEPVVGVHVKNLGKEGKWRFEVGSMPQ